MALTLGIGALFFGGVFLIVAYKGGGSGAMNANLLQMMEGHWPGSMGLIPVSNAPTRGATSTTGGANSSGLKPGTNP